MLLRIQGQVYHVPFRPPWIDFVFHRLLASSYSLIAGLDFAQVSLGRCALLRNISILADIQRAFKA
jgi:hypothetical protein